LSQTGETEWDLIILGDSDMDPAYRVYSEFYEEDLGIRIIKHRLTWEPTLAELPLLLEDPELCEQIQGAEIIVFNIPIVRPSTGGACFDPNKNMESDGCFDISKDEFVVITRQLIRDIKSLVGEKGAMIRL
jgi:hypothetical protein